MNPLPDSFIIERTCPRCFYRTDDPQATECAFDADDKLVPRTFVAVDVLLSDDNILRAGKVLASEYGMEMEFDGIVNDTPYDRDYWLRIVRSIAAELTGKQQP